MYSCLKFIYIKILRKYSARLKERIFGRHKLLEKVFSNISAHSIYSHETKHVVLIWIYALQHRRFFDVLNTINRYSRNCLLQQLGLKLDDMGILRCYGRFANAMISEDTKYPKLLLRYEHF